MLTLAVDGADRALFGGAYVVDNFALVLKALFLVAGLHVVLLSTNYIAEGDYWEGEYYILLLSSVLGMTIMASARDLITIFVALELLSIPAYMLAGLAQAGPQGQRGGHEVLPDGRVRLGGDALRHVADLRRDGQHLLADIAQSDRRPCGQPPVVTLGIVFILVGFGFKVSAVPFHNWAPDTYEGAPTPITAFLAVASKAAGFVALLQLMFVGLLRAAHDVWGPMMWVLAALTMTVGNLIALRQTNIVRMFAYSGWPRPGFMLAPLAVVGTERRRGETTAAVDRDLSLIYAAMNLGAFAVVIAVARKTRRLRSIRSAGCSSTRPAWPQRWWSSCSHWPASRRSPDGSPSSWSSNRW